MVDDSQADSKDDGPVEWISYWKPNVTINLVDDFTKYVSSQFQGSVRFFFYYKKKIKLKIGTYGSPNYLFHGFISIQINCLETK